MTDFKGMKAEFGDTKSGFRNKDIYYETSITFTNELGEIVYQKAIHKEYAQEIAKRWNAYEEELTNKTEISENLALNIVSLLVGKLHLDPKSDEDYSNIISLVKDEILRKSTKAELDKHLTEIGQKEYITDDK